MSSQGHRHDHGHLDATTGREVVYCHACSSEWYRDEHGITCPECQSDAVEIVSPENDPRELDHHSSASTSPEINPFRHVQGEDSDPDEADIEEHLGPHGFAFRRSIRDMQDGPPHHNPGSDPVFSRFFDMVHEIGGHGRAGGGGGSPGGPGHAHYEMPHIHRTTFSTSPFNGGGTASVTIVSGPLHGARGGSSPGDARGDPFQAYAEPLTRPSEQHDGPRLASVVITVGANQGARLFSNMLRDLGPPQDGDQAGGPEGHGGPPQGFARSLQDILGLINPANAMAGDAVYSQEALDRIITGLMEANPQSNAAPPASEEALRNLDRRTVDKGMLGNDEKTECAICIDDLKEGQTAAFLPCKHWFHEECVVLWLKEHNTCPVCRTPMEKTNRDSGSNSRGNSGLNPDQSSGTGSNPGGNTLFGSSGESASWFSPRFPGNGSGSAEHHDPSESWQAHHARPPSQSQSRINEALRSVAAAQRERQREGEGQGEQERGTSSGVSYDTWRFQRRNSHSPTSPRATAPGEHGARMRQRSPSESSRGSLADREGRRQTSHGPLNWLRDRFGGASGSGPGRDDRRS